MAQLHESRVCLRFFGDDLSPAEITALLGAEPSSSETKGQQLPSKSGIRFAKTGHWSLSVAHASPASMDSQVAEILGQLTPDLGIWQMLSGRFSIDLFCGWFMETSNEGISISPATLKALGERGIELVIDLYDPL